MADCAFTVQSPLGYTVQCSSSIWNEHIASGHSLMAKNVDAVTNAISDPVAVYQSDEWPKRDVYFGKSDIATYKQNLYTKVIVDTPDEYNEKGSVVSAWAQKDISGNIDEKGLKYAKFKSR